LSRKLNSTKNPVAQQEIALPPAAKLERRIEKMPGVRRATATYIGHVLCITFDASVASELLVLDGVKAAGADVAPLKRRPWPTPGSGSAFVPGISTKSFLAQDGAEGWEAVTALAVFALADSLRPEARAILPDSFTRSASSAMRAASSASTD
jgi:hypothetical protein